MRQSITCQVQINVFLESEKTKKSWIIKDEELLTNINKSIKCLSHKFDENEK